MDVKTIIAEKLQSGDTQIVVAADSTTGGDDFDPPPPTSTVGSISSQQSSTIIETASSRRPDVSLSEEGELLSDEDNPQTTFSTNAVSTYSQTVTRSKPKKKKTKQKQFSSSLTSQIRVPAPPPLVPIVNRVHSRLGTRPAVTVASSIVHSIDRRTGIDAVTTIRPAQPPPFAPVHPNGTIIPQIHLTISNSFPIHNHDSRAKRKSTAGRDKIDWTTMRSRLSKKPKSSRVKVEEVATRELTTASKWKFSLPDKDAKSKEEGEAESESTLSSASDDDITEQLSQPQFPTAEHLTYNPVYSTSPGFSSVLESNSHHVSPSSSKKIPKSKVASHVTVSESLPASSKRTIGDISRKKYSPKRKVTRELPVCDNYRTKHLSMPPPNFGRRQNEFVKFMMKNFSSGGLPAKTSRVAHKDTSWKMLSSSGEGDSSTDSIAEMDEAAKTCKKFKPPKPETASSKRVSKAVLIGKVQSSKQRGSRVVQSKVVASRQGVDEVSRLESDSDSDGTDQKQTQRSGREHKRYRKSTESCSKLDEDSTDSVESSSSGLCSSAESSTSSSSDEEVEKLPRRVDLYKTEKASVALKTKCRASPAGPELASAVTVNTSHEDITIEKQSTHVTSKCSQTHVDTSLKLCDNFTESNNNKDEVEKTPSDFALEVPKPWRKQITTKETKPMTKNTKKNIKKHEKKQAEMFKRLLKLAEQDMTGNLDCTEATVVSGVSSLSTNKATFAHSIQNRQTSIAGPFATDLQETHNADQKTVDVVNEINVGHPIDKLATNTEIRPLNSCVASRVFPPTGNTDTATSSPCAVPHQSFRGQHSLPFSSLPGVISHSVIHVDVPPPVVPRAVSAAITSQIAPGSMFELSTGFNAGLGSAFSLPTSVAHSSYHIDNKCAADVFLPNFLPVSLQSTRQSDSFSRKEVPNSVTAAPLAPPLDPISFMIAHGFVPPVPPLTPHITNPCISPVSVEYDTYTHRPLNPTPVTSYPPRDHLAHNASASHVPMPDESEPPVKISFTHPILANFLPEYSNADIAPPIKELIRFFPQFWNHIEVGNDRDSLTSRQVAIGLLDSAIIYKEKQSLPVDLKMRTVLNMLKNMKYF